MRKFGWWLFGTTINRGRPTQEVTRMFTKTAIALALVLGAATGALAASKKHAAYPAARSYQGVYGSYQGRGVHSPYAYSQYQGQDLYGLSARIRRDTFTHD